ncbi:CDP-alcohol phosphatidyltransferase family protein [Candidatus Pseudothioglobus singularis]|nr:CDP-alcohol phosphatidyltransferase family protein [Candidatus Pseudothioglobus singularis]
MSANQVTVLSGLVAIAGGLMLSSDSKFIVLFGVICFHLFAILDMSDGEVARYRKQGGVSGHYLDWYMHFVSSSALVIGLFLASKGNFNSTLVLIIGLLAVVNPILDKSVQNAGWTVICWTRLRDIKNNSGLIDNNTKENEETEKFQRKSWIYRRLRFLLLSPLQDHWLPLILLILASIDLLFSIAGFEVLDYKFPLLIYIGIIGPAYLYNRVRRMVKTNALNSGYKRLVYPEVPLKFPEDDFL